MSIDLAQFHQTFIEESFEGLDAMERALMAVDLLRLDAELVNSIFRAAHSIKGGSATFGFTAISEFTHVLETLLDQIRSGKRPLRPSDVNLLLQSVDVLREMLGAIQNKQNPRIAQSQVLQIQFQQLLHESSTAKTPDLPVESVVAGSGAWRIQFIPGRDILKTGNDPLRIFAALAELGTLELEADAAACPTLRELDPENLYLTWNLRLTTNKPREQILEVFDWVLEESSVILIPLFETSVDSDQPAAAPTTLAAPPTTLIVDIPVDGDRTSTSKSQVSESSSIRVGIDKIDSLINMVGELVITQSMLGQLGNDFRVEKLPKLMEGLAQLAENTRELQESVMRIRMLPMSFAFSRFPRMVRDLSQQLNKKVRLDMAGEQTELDKTVMEKIGDPLVHLVRNAVDHGIETPAQRLAAGKPEMGRVLLNAYHQGGNVIIEIVDDGKGLDRDAILRKALERGLVAESDIPTLTDEQVFDLIFLPGFSTAA